MFAAGALCTSQYDKYRQWDEGIASDTSKEFKLEISEASDVVNSNKYGNLPAEIRDKLNHSNNCLGMI